MPQPLSGPGVGLPAPQTLYPNSLSNAPYSNPSNKLGLAPGDAVTIPAGTFIFEGGANAVRQWLDPISGIWRGFSSGLPQPEYLKSDGFSQRVVNPTGCPVAANVTGGGSSYVQSTTTVTANTGGSTWAPIVGGAVSTYSIAAKGANYGVAPLVFVPTPPQAATNIIGTGVGGIPATASSTISSGTVATIVFSNVGAGYQGSTISLVILPSPYDVNLNSTTQITQATAYATLGSSGAITGVLCTNYGAPASPTLTVSGAGTGATVAAVVMTTLTGISVTSGGAGYPNLQTELSTAGGRPAGTPTLTNPDFDMTGFVPRKASVVLNTTGSVISTANVIIDGGLFAGTPNVVLSTSGAPTSAATIGLTLGSAPTIVTLQPAP